MSTRIMAYCLARVSPSPFANVRQLGHCMNPMNRFEFSIFALILCVTSLPVASQGIRYQPTLPPSPVILTSRSSMMTGVIVAHQHREHDKIPRKKIIHAKQKTNTSRANESTNGDRFWSNWALVMPDGAAGWLTLSASDGKPRGELWTVGGGRQLSEMSLNGSTLSFTRHVRVGKPEFEGGPPAGKRVACKYTATVENDVIRLVMHRPAGNGKIENVPFTGNRIPPMPPKPNLSKVKFGEPVELFNGRSLEGWMLTNPKQINGWRAIGGELVNTTPKLDFAPYSRYGNLRTKQEFMDFHLRIEFKVPPGGNSGIYLRGVYEAQVLDRDSKMQGIQGVGAIFGRIEPTENAGKLGGQWNSYDITLVDRHVTVILNGKKVIDNQPIAGCTNGALHADDTIPGPLYLQGDHTAVSYRNIVLRPVIAQR